MSAAQLLALVKKLCTSFTNNNYRVQSSRLLSQIWFYCSVNLLYSLSVIVQTSALMNYNKKHLQFLLSVSTNPETKPKKNVECKNRKLPNAMGGRLYVTWLFAKVFLCEHGGGLPVRFKYMSSSNFRMQCYLNARTGVVIALISTAAKMFLPLRIVFSCMALRVSLCRFIFISKVKSKVKIFANSLKK